ncbi:zinc finger protein 567-like isoform X2 [Erpetoichthys calabaricus]|uniref:Zinc finger protein 397-like n=1 Tax=Erpetoichthys calabaricus TaxID=27687 RepID=A0A8C4XG19_ERPCA|nr:zinc finger protein 567-like isoform X2 [Erpetoichthys calabaricus]
MACGLSSTFERDVSTSSRLLQGTLSDFTDSGTFNADKHASVVSEMGAPTAVNKEAVQAAVEIIMTKFTGIAIIIEEAVKAAVEILTARFRGCFDRKFADFQLELSVKDKEIESLKLQLEVFKRELSALQGHNEPEGKSMEEAATAEAAENENELFSMKEEIQNGGDLEKESVASLQEDKGRVSEQSCRYEEDEDSVINLPVHGDGGLWHQFVQIKEETSTPDTALIKEEVCEEGTVNPEIQGSEVESCCMSGNESPRLQTASAYGSPDADVPIRQMSIHRRCCSPLLLNDREQQEIKTPMRDSNRKGRLSAAQRSHKSSSQVKDEICEEGSVNTKRQSNSLQSGYDTEEDFLKLQSANPEMRELARPTSIRRRRCTPQLLSIGEEHGRAETLLWKKRTEKPTSRKTQWEDRASNSTHTGSNLQEHWGSFITSAYQPSPLSKSHGSCQEHPQHGEEMSKPTFLPVATTDECVQRSAAPALAVAEMGTTKSPQWIQSSMAPHHCPICGKRFKMKRYLNRHQRIHTGEKPFCCSECGKRFLKKYHLQQHEKTHAGDKPFSCAQCGKRFGRKYYLQQHQRIHTGEKPYGCSQCGQRFLRKDYLQQHHLSHTGEKPYCCSQCGKKLKHKISLVHHQWIHTGEKLHCCSECGKRFTLKSNLQKHQRIHTGEKPYCCTECGKRFTQKSHLQQHQCKTMQLM